MTWTPQPETLHDPLHRLGRHIDRPDDFDLRQAAQAPANRDVKYQRHCPPFNQGDVGSCTGNAAAGALMTDPFYVTGRNFTESNAVEFYSEATHYNSAGGGYYPPNDVGSSGPAVAQALEADKLISSYGHVTNVNDALGALALAPGIFGVSWYDSFDNTDKTGRCALTSGATVRGGHEIECFGVDLENKQFWFYQSWGPTWGGLGNGTFWISFDDMDTLFSQGADGTFFSVAPGAPSTPTSTSVWEKVRGIFCPKR